MSKKKRENAQPPQPPEITREFHLHLFQLIGIPLMMLIPVLALLGVFGQSDHIVRAASPELELRIEYPTRFRYKMIGSVEVSLSNLSSQPIDRLQVAIDESYIAGFSTVTFTPSLHAITDRAYIMEVRELQPGETRRVTVEIQAEKYGRHRGLVRVTPEGGEALEVSVETITYP